MDALRLVATADNHLSRYHARMSPARLEERRTRLRAGFAAAAEYALAHRAHLFLHGGDLFDSPSPTNADLRFVAACLERLASAGIPVFAVGGNHDTPSGRSVQGGVAPLAALASLGGLTYFGSPQLETSRVRLNGAELRIGGLTPSPGQNATDPLDALLGTEGEDVDIFLTHGALEGHGSGAQEPLLRLRTARRLPNLGLVVAGHVHARATERAGSAVLLAPGATEWMTHGETSQQPGFTSLLWRDGRVAGIEHIAVEPQPRVTLELEVEETGEQPHAAALALMERHASPDALARFRLSGAATRQQYADLRLRALQQSGEALYFHFDMDATGLRLRDEFARAATRGVRVSQPEEIAMVAAELIAGEPDPSERARWTEARDALLEHYR